MVKGRHIKRKCLEFGKWHSLHRYCNAYTFKHTMAEVVAVMGGFPPSPNSFLLSFDVKSTSLGVGLHINKETIGSDLNVLQSTF